LLWLKNKWIDYVAPQLYWEFSQKVVPFATLIDWWANHTYGRQLYIGHGVYRAFESKSVAWKNPNELPDQIKKVREYSQVQGSIYFSSKTFNRNPNGWNDSLQNNYYKYPAIIPPMPWIDSVKPTPPTINAIRFDIEKNVYYIGGELKKPINNIKKIAVFIYNNDIPSSQQLEKIFIFQVDKNLFPLAIPAIGILPTQKFSIVTISKTNVSSLEQSFLFKDEVFDRIIR